ncbi:MAG: hypothetical protein JW940_38300 [Polyangiaceae bacterium]|nr:hypothetical protein [Polyangiaceae bacterium]
MQLSRTVCTLACPIVLACCLGACGGDTHDSRPKSECIVGSSEGCGRDHVCEAVEGGGSACFEPIRVAGRVFDSSNDQGIEGAVVVARDANEAAASGLATTESDGSYSLIVPVERDSKGNPTNLQVTMRADAAGYLTFPLPPRVALPVALDRASDGVVSSSATGIALVPLPDATGLGSVEGRVAIDDPTGTLVVVGSSTALAGTDGSFTAFNVPAGEATVRGYRVGVNLEPETVEVSANKVAGPVELHDTGPAKASVRGKVAIVNPGNGTDTSVILVVQDTFVENAARGEAPPGLRVERVTGDFLIESVPDGKYYALAAFENDSLVRDPDTSIGGTAIVAVEVSGANVVLDEGFKITGSLDVVSPDAEEETSATPALEWVDDSGEDHYEVAVYDAFGNLVWEDREVAGVSGNKNVSVPYAGPALTTGMVYQFRATSIKKGGSPISRTEDLRGVFRIR